MKKKIIRWLLSVLTAVSCLTPGIGVHAETSSIEVVDFKMDEEMVLQTFATLKSAFDYYEMHRDDASVNNLGVRQNGKLIAVSEGIVFFASEGCKVNTEYKDTHTGNDGYTNGCYGADGALISTDWKTSRVTFKIAGVEGRGKLSEVTLLPLSRAGNLSSYTIRSGRLYHQIRQSQASSRYATLIDLGPAPAMLSDESTLYSYDGHYFYQDAEVMLKDYRQGQTAHALNASQPFYFYYQYLSHRTLTHYSAEDLKDYFQKQLGIDRSMTAYRDRDRNSVHDTLNQSLYYNEEQDFLEYQSLYGANALMMLALSMNESATGRSSLSFTRNNLFGHAAYDSDVEKNAKRYFQLSSSILSHARTYVSASYLNPKKFQYHGGFFGDKASGMNVSYASDPYWGEKAASYYMALDEALGSRDLNQQTLGIRTAGKALDVKKEPSAAAETLYSTGASLPMSFVLLNRVENAEGAWYQIQNDPASDMEEYTYNFIQDIGYIPADAVQLVLNEEKLGMLELTSVVFDAQGGTFPDGRSRIEISVLAGGEPLAPTPAKDGAVFAGWKEDQDIMIAQYRNVESLRIVKTPRTNYETGERIDLAGGLAEVQYQDGKLEQLPMTTSMVSGFDLSTEGPQQVTVSWGSKTAVYTIEVSATLSAQREALMSDIETMVEAIDPEAVTEPQTADLIELKQRIDEFGQLNLSLSQIRALDTLFQTLLKNQRSLVLNAKDKQFAVSGLSLAVKQKNPGASSWMKDTLKISLNLKQPDAAVKAQTEMIAAGNHAEIWDYFVLSGKKNFGGLELNSTIAVTMSLPSGFDTSKKVTVWRLEDGNVIQMPTTQSKTTLTFRTEALGQFVITSRQTVNQYEDEAPDEVMTKADNGIDWPETAVKALIALVLLLSLMIVVLILQRRKDKKRRRQMRRRAAQQRRQDRSRR